MSDDEDVPTTGYTPEPDPVDPFEQQAPEVECPDGGGRPHQSGQPHRVVPRGGSGVRVSELAQHGMGGFVVEAKVDGRWIRILDDGDKAQAQRVAAEARREAGLEV